MLCVSVREVHAEWGDDISSNGEQIGLGVGGWTTVVFFEIRCHYTLAWQAEILRRLLKSPFYLTTAHSWFILSRTWHPMLKCSVFISLT